MLRVCSDRVILSNCPSTIWLDPRVAIRGFGCSSGLSTNKSNPQTLNLRLAKQVKAGTFSRKFGLPVPDPRSYFVVKNQHLHHGVRLMKASCLETRGNYGKGSKLMPYWPQKVRLTIFEVASDYIAKRRSLEVVGNGCLAGSVCCFDRSLAARVCPDVTPPRRRLLRLHPSPRQRLLLNRHPRQRLQVHPSPTRRLLQVAERDQIRKFVPDFGLIDDMALQMEGGIRDPVGWNDPFIGRCWFYAGSTGRLHGSQRLDVSQERKFIEINSTVEDINSALP